MWLFTPRGFFSAVRKPDDAKDDMLTIRARDKADLEQLADLLPEAVPYAKKYSDYPWRIRIPQKDWALALARMALEIDYDNFKDEVKRTQGSSRAGTYGQVWSVMLQVDPTYKKTSYGGGGGGGSWKTEKRTWKKGDRAWDSVKKRAATVRSNGKSLRVHYDGDADNVSTVVSFPSDLRTLWSEGDTVYDSFQHKFGTITKMEPLQVTYDDGKQSKTSVFWSDLKRPEDTSAQRTTSTATADQLQLPSGGFADQQESGKQKRSKGKRGNGRKHK